MKWGVTQTKLQYLVMKPSILKKCQKSLMDPLSTPVGVKTELIFALQLAVFEIRADFQNCHIRA